AGRWATASHPARARGSGAGMARPGGPRGARLPRHGSGLPAQPLDGSSAGTRPQPACHALARAEAGTLDAGTVSAPARAPGGDGSRWGDGAADGLRTPDAVSRRARRAVCVAGGGHAVAAWTHT